MSRMPNRLYVYCTEAENLRTSVSHYQFFFGDLIDRPCAQRLKADCSVHISLDDLLYVMKCHVIYD